MRVKFLADEDLDGRVVKALRRKAPEIDIRTAHEAVLRGLRDPEVLRVAAEQGRTLVSQDRRTMPAHFVTFVSGTQSPGVILLRGATPILAAVEDLVMIWSASEPAEWINRMVWIPF